MKEDHKVYWTLLGLWIIILIFTLMIYDLKIPTPEYETNIWNTVNGFTALTLFMIPGFILGYWFKGKYGSN